MSATAGVADPPRGVNTGSPQDISEINSNMQAFMLAFQESQATNATANAQVAMMLVRMDKQASEHTARIEASETATQDAINDVRNSIAMMTPARGNAEADIRNNRRSSLLFEPQELSNGAVIKVQKEIPQDQKIHTLTYRSIIAAEKTMLHWHHSGMDATKKLQDFFSDKVLQQLVDNELRLETPVSNLLTMATIHDLQGPAIMDMVARKLRPQTTTNYYTAVAETVQEPKPRSNKWEFGFMDYDKELHAAIAKMVEQLRTLYNLIHLNVTTEEAQLWPKTEYGKKDKPGLLRVYAKALGKFEEPFTERITEDALKNMKTLPELFDAIVKVNNELCNVAKELTGKTAQFHKPDRLEDVYRAVRDGRTQASFTAGKGYNQTQTGTPLAPPNAGQDFKRGRAEYGVNSNTTPRGQSWNRLRDLEASPMSPDEMHSRLSQIHPEEDAGHDDDYEQGLYELLAYSPVPPPSQHGLFHGKVSPRPPASTLPCYKLARGEEHDQNQCPYSHDPETYKNAMHRHVEAIIETLGVQWLQQAAEKVNSNRAQRRKAEAGVRDQRAINGVPPSVHNTPQLARVRHQVNWTEDREDSHGEEDSVRDEDHTKPG